MKKQFILNYRVLQLGTGPLRPNFMYIDLLPKKTVHSLGAALRLAMYAYA